MQLARNLYLGHERTLSRKAQEVVLAWMLEHLTGVSKGRLLEIYLNIIEWGPGRPRRRRGRALLLRPRRGRGSRSTRRCSSPPSCPRPRSGASASIATASCAPFARAQMHFIGRAMIAKGWLEPERLPPADALDVEIRGAARRVLFPEEVAEDVESIEA